MSSESNQYGRCRSLVSRFHVWFQKPDSPGQEKKSICLLCGALKPTGVRPCEDESNSIPVFSQFIKPHSSRRAIRRVQPHSFVVVPLRAQAVFRRADKPTRSFMPWIPTGVQIKFPQRFNQRKRSEPRICVSSKTFLVRESLRCHLSDQPITIAICKQLKSTDPER
jgi:hypothetical protein